MTKLNAAVLASYPEEREDWNMAIAYSEKKSKLGCLLCEKTHFAKDCPNRVVKNSVEKSYKSMYEKDDDLYTSQVNYGW